MRDVFRIPFNDEPAESDPPGFGVVIAYEDFETGKHARKTCDFLEETLGKQLRFAQNMWKFDVLGIPHLREMAVHDVAESDIVIISSHGGADLPPGVRAWIEHWVALGIRPLALVALFDCAVAQVNGVREYLEGVAGRLGIKFFAQPQQRPSVPPASGRPATLPAAAMERSKALHTLQGAVQREVHIPRWGINE